MVAIGRVASLWRYPVKSMCGEEIEHAYVGFSGMYGDRLYAFKSTAKKAGFPYLTARDRSEMLRFRPRFRHPDQASKPINQSQAEKLGPGLTPLYADPADMVVDVETPGGEILAVDAPELIRTLCEELDDKHELSLLRSDRSMTDCRPISLFSIQTARQLGKELGRAIDKRRFRANIYASFDTADGFAEDGYVGRSLRIGSKAVISILERDPRCKMITLDPDTGESDPAVLKVVAQGHENLAGVYAAVLVEGTIRRGDPIELV